MLDNYILHWTTPDLLPNQCRLYWTILNYIPEQTGHEYVIGFDTIEINLIFLVASKMGLVIVLANLASEMKPSLDFFLCVKSDSKGICSTKDIFPFWII